MHKRVVRKDNGVIARKGNTNKKDLALPNGSQTLLQELQSLVNKKPNEPFLGSIVNDKIIYKTYAEFYQATTRLASFLEEITKDGSIIGLYSVNRYEWIVGEYASYLAHCINCPIFSNHSPESLLCILNETELEVLIASGDKARGLLNTIFKDEENTIRHIILMDNDPDLINKLKERGIKGYYLGEIIAKERKEVTRKEPSPEDVATICYTSGTSGYPKGAMLTHKNFISAISGFLKCRDPNDILRFEHSDVYISYLPLPHVLERVCFSIVMSAGIKICFYRGNPRDLQKDCKIIKPTFIVTVPRVLNVFKEKIEASVNGLNFFKRAVFRFGLWYKERLQRWLIEKSWLFDSLVFNKVSKEFGGRLRCCLCGGASLNPEVLRFIKATMCMKVFQGYGQTEGLAANIIMPLDIYDDESVGIPFPGIEARIDSPSEYGNDVGELMMKGSHIMKGYYKNPDATSKVLSEDGWLRTGDLAKEVDGKFYIVGRISEVFKTSFGEYIVPEALENHFIGGIIEDMFITTSRFSDFLVALVVCEKRNVSLERIKSEIAQRAAVLVSEKKIMRYEIPSGIILVRKPFAAYSGPKSHITPSLKKCRRNIAEYFKEQIEKEFKALE